MLAAAGIKDAYSVIDGVEGDKVTDPDSVFVGKRVKNGWKNSAPGSTRLILRRSSLKRGSRSSLDLPCIEKRLIASADDIISPD